MDCVHVDYLQLSHRVVEHLKIIYFFVKQVVVVIYWPRPSGLVTLAWKEGGGSFVNLQFSGHLGY